MIIAIVNNCALRYKVSRGNHHDSSLVSVEEDLGSHQLQRLVDLLTVHECEELLMRLSKPEEHIFSQLNHLSEETNQFSLPSRRPRDTGIDILSLIFIIEHILHKSVV